MTGASPGDPHSLLISWKGGSMFWESWRYLKALQKLCYDYTQNGMVITDAIVSAALILGKEPNENLAKP